MDAATPVPLSFAQERLWFLHQLAPQSAFYNLQIDLPLSFYVDETVLRHVLAEIVRRHEILRTVFSSLDGQPVQHVLATMDVTLSCIDLRDLPPSGPGGSRAAPGRGGRGASLRPDAWPAAPLHRSASRRRKLRALPHDAPHRHRRVVDGPADAGDRGALRGVRTRRSVPVARTADPVCRLRRLAASDGHRSGHHRAVGGTGSNSSPATPAWSCRPTIHGRQCPATAVDSSPPPRRRQ